MKAGSFCILINFFILITIATSKKSSKESKPEWAKKDIRDYSEADLERLLDQWEVIFNKMYSEYNGFQQILEFL